MALFGVASVRQVLRRLWTFTPIPVRQPLWDIMQSQHRTDRARPRERSYTTCDNSVRLAVIFRACLQPPRAAEIVPRLLTDRYYGGQQEDAVEFLQTAFLEHTLEARPATSGGVRPQSRAMQLTQLCEGGRQYSMRCATCGHMTEPGPEEKFTIVDLAVTSEDGARTFATVDEAMTHYLLPETLPADFRFQCEACASVAAPQRSVHLSRHPQVLIVQLKRWNPDNLDEPLQHVVRPDSRLDVSGVVYTLAGFVCHLGNSIRHGHYTACVRYPNSEGEWWHYDDARTNLARPAHLNAQPGAKLYLAFYERDAERGPVGGSPSVGVDM